MKSLHPEFRKFYSIDQLFMDTQGGTSLVNAHTKCALIHFSLIPTTSSFLQTCNWYTVVFLWTHYASVIHWHAFVHMTGQHMTGQRDRNSSRQTQETRVVYITFYLLLFLFLEYQAQPLFYELLIQITEFESYRAKQVCMIDIHGCLLHFLRTNNYDVLNKQTNTPFKPQTEMSKQVM